MSKESWLAEFYPIPANRATKAEAVSHSLQKWKGLTEESLQKHKLEVPPISISGDTCALCHQYAKKFNPKPCQKCPIKLRNGIDCNGEDNNEEWVTDVTPFTTWLGDQDPQPMIDLLQLLKDKEDEQRKLVS